MGLVGDLQTIATQNYVQANSTNVVNAATNGNILIDGLEVSVYTPPLQSRGINSFAGEKIARIIPHSLGTVPVIVCITPKGDPGGNLGEFWYTSDVTNIYVYNSGTGITDFSWFAQE
jgi:hypothetical protein